MGTAANSTVKGLARGVKAKPALVLLVVPFIGIVGLIWKASHTIGKPEISIYRAAERGSYEDVEAHILTGTPVNTLSGEGHSPLYYAVLSGKMDVVKLLLANGASPNAEGGRRPTPLYAAAGEGNLAMVNALIAAGANPKEQQTSGATPLFAAADSKNPAIVKLLLDKGADANARLKNVSGTPLCNACITGNLESVKLLIDHGADVKARAFGGRTPLHYAAQSGHYDVVRLLIDRGADAGALDDNSVLPLSSALARHVDERISWLLLNHTKKVQSFDYHLCSPLHYAADSGASVKLINALLARGCNPNQVNFQRDTPLDLAVAKGRLDIEEALVKGGARISLQELIRRALEPAKPGVPQLGTVAVS